MTLMKPLLTLLTATLLCVSVMACDNASKGTSSTYHIPSNATATNGDRATTAPNVATPGGYLKSDSDNDKDDGNPHDTAEHADNLVAAYGKRASRADKRTVTTLIKHYYTAAVADDGAKACSLLDSTLATGLGEGQGQSGQSGGETCATAVSLAFKQQHEQLVADDIATMIVIAVHVKGDVGMATLGFRAVPVGEILVKRERGTWKMDALFDTGLT